MNPKLAKDMSDHALCVQSGVEVYRVGDIYHEDESGNPIPAADLEKFCVTTPAHRFAEEAVRAVPLADSVAEAEALAVKYLDLSAAVA